ncbi:MAG: hypothetical protein HFH23_01720 [Ruminococcus sp.]|nr:hypothetical protein [Ruminococcus sp.]
MIRHKWTQNVGLKITAFVFAVVLWILAVNVDDPVKSTTVRNVPIVVVNEEVVTNKGKTYQILDGVQSVNVTVYGKRSVISKLDSDNLVVTADLSEMEVNTFLVPLSVSLQGLSEQEKASITEFETTPKNLQVRIEDRIKKDFPISISTTGTPRDGFVVGEMTTNPEKISFGGPESQVNSIARVVASVSVSGMSTDEVKPAKLLLYDGNGNVMDDSLLSNNLGVEGVSVNVQMLRSKDVRLSFEASETPAEGYVCTGWSFEPERIQVCGTKEALSGLTEIRVPPDVIGLEGADSKQDVTVDISPYLPEGVRLVDESASNVLLTVTVEEIGVRTIELPVESISINNLADDLKVSFGGNGILELRFTGMQEELDKLDIRNAASIDLSGYTKEGIYEVEVHVEEAASAVRLLDNPKIRVILTEKRDE